MEQQASVVCGFICMESCLDIELPLCCPILLVPWKVSWWNS